MIILIPIAKTTCPTSDVKDARIEHIEQNDIVDQASLLIIYDQTHFKVVKTTDSGLDKINLLYELSEFIDTEMTTENLKQPD